MKRKKILVWRLGHFGTISLINGFLSDLLGCDSERIKRIGIRGSGDGEIGDGFDDRFGIRAQVADAASDHGLRNLFIFT